MLRAQLLASPKILFAGYQVPHPLKPQFLIKIQTDGSQTPQEALEEACSQLVTSIASLQTKFEREFSFRDVDAPAGVSSGVGLDADPYGVQSGAGGQGWSSGRDYLDL
jgi:DNA-directed RNA polymerase II subunit RPB11